MSNYSKHIITGDTRQTSLVLDQLLADNEWEVPFEKLKLPKSLPTFKLREIFDIADKIETGLLNEPIVVNKDFMIVKGLKRYYALKRLGRTRVKVCIGCYEVQNKNNAFSIRK
ncbi:ParB N-terminal domain-containing protein [Aquirufa aurantiipilula]|uniref:ParB N-terminal domain-containing protein n=1 Tax=Aquirufa aurantiipilula TaxID=2696561 RepID=A0ABT6BMA0_9BACT|nr:ParB N-terminal domain-containing protein [Aquirufa aurantiipilula]MDF5691607.1 ParB N-terminal domain-containing protein [Aquirufa aurantiipilula]